MTAVADAAPPRAPGAVRFSWPDLAGRYYRQRPCEFADPPDVLRFEPDELFRLLVGACAGRGTGPRQPQVRFHVGAAQVLADVGDFLPVEADQSLDGYLARLEAQLGGAPYLLVVQRAQAASRPLWRRAAGFLARLEDETGRMAPGNADVELFAGRYPATAPGIHRERSGVFVSAVTGAKDMLVWPPAATDLPLGTLRYQAARASATRLRCAPGRLAYWPALHWHVAECPAAPAAAVHIAAVEEPLRLADVIARTMADVPDELPADLGRLAGDQAGDLAGAGGVVALPGSYEAALSVLAAHLGDTARVRDQLTADWLRRRTGLGFTAPPPRYRELAVAAGDVVVRDSVRPIVLARRDATTSWCAADGRVAEVRSAAVLADLVGQLNSGQQVPVPELTKLAGSAADERLVRRTLSLLAAWRAIRVAR